MAFCTGIGGLSLCVMGVAPMSLIMLPKHMVMGPTGPLGNIMDTIPMLNIPSYVMCNSTLPIPKPCIPSTTPWCAPVPTVLIDNMPAFDNTAKSICALGGVVNIMVPTQFNLLVG